MMYMLAALTLVSLTTIGDPPPLAHVEHARSYFVARIMLTIVLASFTVLVWMVDRGAL